MIVERTAPPRRKYFARRKQDIQPRANWYLTES